MSAAAAARYLVVVIPVVIAADGLLDRVVDVLVEVLALDAGEGTLGLLEIAFERFLGGAFFTHATRLPETRLLPPSRLSGDPVHKYRFSAGPVAQRIRARDF